MKNRPLSIALASLGVAGMLITLQTPADAAKGEPKKRNPGPDLTESGCRDITFGKAGYVRDRTVDLAVLEDPETRAYPDEFQADAGTATIALSFYTPNAQTGGVEGGVPSCPDVDYTLTIYGIDKQQLGQTVIKPGDGTTGTEANRFVISTRVAGYSEDCLLLVAATSVASTVVDTAPDPLPENFAQSCDNSDGGLTYK